MGVADVAFGDAEAVDFAPFGAVAAGQDQDGGGGVDHVAAGAGAEGEVVSALELDEVSERVVFAVVEEPANVFDPDAGRSGAEARDHKRGSGEGEAAASGHGLVGRDFHLAHDSRSSYH